ncbi:MAG TPA: carboxypeptidase regulatory-like domain-containing protein, partial [Candidatus Baltobacteraceae bacterium]|nr:carboxypeptidase regulatory-like domain-containing protein [Candidatus Baltobacteraceae bacterium]
MLLLPRNAFRAPVLLVALLCLAFAAQLRADTISGTVKDPSGAAVAGARVEISGGNLKQPVVLTSDNTGKFTAPDLAAGQYSVRVTKDGFAELVTPVDLHGAATLALGLTIAEEQTRVTVSGRISPFANSDSVYRALRDIKLGETYRVEEFILPLDVGSFELKSGTITFLQPVNGFITGAVFVGSGHFTLKPVLGIDVREMERRAGAPTAEEDFTSVVFRFTPGQYPALTKELGGKTDTPPEAETAFEDWQNQMRRRHDPPEGFTQEILESETMDNVDADVLASIYNPHHPPFFNAYMHGSPHKDLRFYVRARVGAIPSFEMQSPEEVALINCAGGGMDDGVWYSQHLMSELQARTANSREDRRIFATRSYQIETDIGKNDHLYSRATITFEPLIPNERVLKFGLLPTLRVTRVVDQNGKDLHYVQEDKKQDGSFYAILDEAVPVGQQHSISVEYVGDKVLFNAGNGSYYVGARTSWYPNLNGFGEKALYDLTFKVPHPNVVIGVGKLAGQSTEAGFDVTHWVTPAPVAIAGFNYGQYRKMDFPDDVTHYNISGYYLPDLPDSLKPYEAGSPMSEGGMAPLSGMAPGAMTKYALDQTRAQLQLCTFYFGKAPYDTVDITEQPDFTFGQSWPNLVYLPISAYIDSTQRWLLFGQIDRGFNGFVQEVTPHEVAHQWFGHGVGWASYHDQWLSEGFAQFAAGLFLQQAVGAKWQKDYLDFWERQRHSILDKNNFGISPNDAGPLWLGLRLISPRSEDAYQGDTYAKGAYVLLMLRSLMYDDSGANKNKDQAFIDMMHDYMETYRDSPASTEAFKAIAEKHITPAMDLTKNGKLDWFFAEWVYGTAVPRYEFKYQMMPGDGGKVRVRAEITQSEVDEHFAMLVPVFADFGNGMVRLGQVE